MNERIKELMTEAGMLYTLDSMPIHIDENGTHTFQEIYVYTNFDPEKFALLIAQECSEIARGVMREEGSTMSWDDLNSLQNQIKELVGGW